MYRKDRSKRTRKTRPKGAREDRAAAGGRTVILRTPAADSMVVRLKYVDPNFVFGNSPNFYWSVRYLMNSAYDVNPNIGGGSYSYFAEYAAMYIRYRVLRFHYWITLVNQTSGTMIVGVVPTKEDVGGNYPTMNNLAENPYGKSKLIGPNTGLNKAEFSGTIDLAQFTGHHGYLYDDATASLVTGNPSQQAFFNIGANAYTATTSTSIGGLFRFEIDVAFFDRKYQDA